MTAGHKGTWQGSEVLAKAARDHHRCDNGSQRPGTEWINFFLSCSGLTVLPSQHFLRTVSRFLASGAGQGTQYGRAQEFYLDPSIRCNLHCSSIASKRGLVLHLSPATNTGFRACNTMGVFNSALAAKEEWAEEAWILEGEGLQPFSAYSLA